MSNLRPKVKGQPGPLGLIYSHCRIKLSISNTFNDFDLKSTSHFNTLGSKFEYVKVKQGLPFEQTL